MLIASSLGFENYAKTFHFQVILMLTMEIPQNSLFDMQFFGRSISVKYVKNSGIVKINIRSRWLHFQFMNLYIFQA